MGMLIGIAATAITFFIVAYLLPQVDFSGDVIQLVILAVIFGVVNGLIKPVVRIFSFPINAMTLGLFGLVINAVLLLAVAWAADAFGVPFSIGGFPPALTADAFVAAIIGSIAISVVGTLVGLVVHD